MDQIKLNTSEAPTINVGEIKGSLRIKGWDFDKLRVDSDKENTLKVDQDNDNIKLECSSGCQLRVPTQSKIIIERVSRELMAKSLEGHLDVKDVKGQIIVKNISSITVSNADSNVTAKQIEGDIKFGHINGNITIRNVEGFIEVDKCDGNLSIRGYSKGFRTNSNGNTFLRLVIDSGCNYVANTQSNILCRVESNTNAQVSLKSGSSSIRVRTPEFKEVLSEQEYDFQIGEGDSQINLEAEGGIEFRVLSPSDDFSYDFGFEEDFENLADDISQQISDQIETQIGSITEQLGNILTSSVSIGVGASERTRRNLEAKRRALERKLTKAQRRVDKKIRARVHAQRSYVRPTSDPVSEEEQKMILEMLQNNQISIEEAEVLLAALEGKTVEAQPQQNETGAAEEPQLMDEELPEEEVEPTEESEAEADEKPKK